MSTAYFPSVWPAEDGGALRQQRSGSIEVGTTSRVTSRLSIASTMVVQRHPGEWFLLCHTGGEDTVSWVEKFDPLTLEVLARSEDLPAGPAWPGGIGVHANGDIYVVYGRYAHRLSPSLEVVARCELPRNRPYNSFVLLADGTVVTKDFGGARPGDDPHYEASDCELVALTPELEILSRLTLPEGSVARLSADDHDVYIVGSTALHRVVWRRGELALDPSFEVHYRREGEGYGWDPVIADGAAWFLNNGAGSEQFDGSLVGKGVATAGLSLISVDLETGEERRWVVDERPGGIVANPPAIDAKRGIAVAYDSAHGVVVGIDYRDDSAPLLWRKNQNHACHPLVFDGSGLVMLNDFNIASGLDGITLCDLETGDEVFRADTESPLQSVLFGAPGENNDIYLCSFTHLTRVALTR